MSLPSIIAIDGPAGSGKSTISYRLAERYGYLFVDTGIFYRTITWVALHEGIPLDDAEALTQLAMQTTIEITPTDPDSPYQSYVFANQINVTDHIRSAEVEAAVSIVSAVSGVREAMVEQQRKVANQGNIIMAGRDIGTVVLPFADIKLYIDASLEERAKRRFAEKVAKGQTITNFEDMMTALGRRDKIDSEREISPLRIADDAVYIHTDNKSIDEVVDEIAQQIDLWQPA